MIHRALLRALLCMMRYELAIGRSTGRNPADISALRCDIVRMETDLMRLEAQHA